MPSHSAPGVGANEKSEQRQLVGIMPAVDRTMQAGIHAITKAWKSLPENVQRPLTRGREARPRPDLVNATRIAVVTGHDILAAHPKPPRDPDIDGILFAEANGLAGGGWRGRIYVGTHDEGPDETQIVPRRLTQRHIMY